MHDGWNKKNHVVYLAEHELMEGLPESNTIVEEQGP